MSAIKKNLNWTCAWEKTFWTGLSRLFHTNSQRVVETLLRSSSASLSLSHPLSHSSLASPLSVAEQSADLLCLCCNFRRFKFEEIGYNNRARSVHGLALSPVSQFVAVWARLFACVLVSAHSHAHKHTHARAHTIVWESKIMKTKLLDNVWSAFRNFLEYARPALLASPLNGVETSRVSIAAARAAGEGNCCRSSRGLEIVCKKWVYYCDDIQNVEMFLCRLGKVSWILTQK